jgi:uncharacterized membrane protein
VRRGGGRRLNAEQSAFIYQKSRLVGLVGALVAGLLVLFFAPSWLRGTVRPVAAYDAGAILVLAFDWLFALRNNATHTERRAAQADPGRNVVLFVVLLSVAAGLASAIIILGKGPAVPASDRGLALTFGLLAVALGWFLIHTTFIFRYAHLFYYDSDADGTAQRGLTFPGTNEPDDYDFAYFSFVIGMTFQVSDVQITDPGVRSLALFHALLSFGYNTAILALGVNLASSLLNAGH